MEGIEGGTGIAGPCCLGQDGGEWTFQFVTAGLMEEGVRVQAEVQPIGVLAQKVGEVGGCGEDGEEEAGGGFGPMIQGNGGAGGSQKFQGLSGPLRIGALGQERWPKRDIHRGTMLGGGRAGTPFLGEGRGTGE